MTINRFKGEYRFLSNFYPCEIEFEGDVYPSVEHAYQAAKTTNPINRLPLQSFTMSASIAKKHGRCFNLRSDWEEIKIPTMRELLLFKFENHPELRKKLEATAGWPLIEGNNWHDNIWGSCYCSDCGNVGKNLLGNLLVELRDSILV